MAEEGRETIFKPTLTGEVERIYPQPTLKERLGKVITIEPGTSIKWYRIAGNRFEKRGITAVVSAPFQAAEALDPDPKFKHKPLRSGDDNLPLLAAQDYFDYYFREPKREGNETILVRVDRRASAGTHFTVIRKPVQPEEAMPRPEVKVVEEVQTPDGQLTQTQMFGEEKN